MRAYILCGGFGTRLRSVIKNTQKAVVEVNGQPFLQIVLEQLAKAGVKETILCAHYHAEQIAEKIEQLANVTGLTIRMVVELEPMGTGGALLNALVHESEQERYLVINADTYLDAAGYSSLIAEKSNAVLGVNIDERLRYGSLNVDLEGFLRALLEKGQTGAGLINAGAYLFTPQAFQHVPLRACSLEQELLPELLRRKKIKVVEYSGRFIDIGTPEALERYIEEFQVKQ